MGGSKVATFLRDVRQTIEHFVTLGRYADVRVFGEPDGEGVRLRYEVVPVERVTRLVFQGPPDCSIGSWMLRPTDGDLPA